MKRIKFELYANVDPKSANKDERSKTALKKAMNKTLKTIYPDANVVIRTTTEDYS